MFMVDDIDDKDFLKVLLESMYDELPEPPDSGILMLESHHNIW